MVKFLETKYTFHPIFLFMYQSNFSGSIIFCEYVFARDASRMRPGQEIWTMRQGILRHFRAWQNACSKTLFILRAGDVSPFHLDARLIIQNVAYIFDKIFKDYENFGIGQKCRGRWQIFFPQGHWMLRVGVFWKFCFRRIQNIGGCDPVRKNVILIIHIYRVIFSCSFSLCHPYQTLEVYQQLGVLLNVFL